MEKFKCIKPFSPSVIVAWGPGFPELFTIPEGALIVREVCDFGDSYFWNGARLGLLDTEISDYLRPF